jgi:hypothetical protein
MLKNRIFFFICCIFIFSSNTIAQLSESEAFKKRAKRLDNAVLINPSYSANFSLLDLKQRFGFYSNVGMLLGLRLQSNWMVGVEGNFLFGNTVKETNILNKILPPDLNMVSIEGEIQTPRISMEGFGVKFVGEKLFKVSKKLSGSGIFIQAGVGFIQHKILIRAPTRLFPQLDKTYRKGYDRMSNGFVTSLSTGFKFLERKKFLSFNIGATAELGFTQNRRAWNFDEERKDSKQRLDMFVGVKLGWIIPVFLYKDNVDIL